MIRGLGTDILEVSRMEKAMEKPDFAKKVFTENEIKYIDSHRYNRYRTAAGLFCAKEAFLKALGTGLSGTSLVDVEILHDKMGKPYIDFHGVGEIISQLSIAHSDRYATATVIIF